MTQTTSQSVTTTVATELQRFVRVLIPSMKMEGASSAR
jgi:hypothetical protein